MKQRVSLKKSSFKKEFKRQLKMGIAAAVGFTIAYAWREPILILANNFVERFVESNVSLQLSIFAALTITLLGVLILWITARILR